MVGQPFANLPPSDQHTRRLGSKYYSVTIKYLFAQIGAIIWLAISLLIALPWFKDLSYAIGWPLTIFSVFGVAVIPGYCSSFVTLSALFDRRPKFFELQQYPPITVLVAAYNEEGSISDTIYSILRQNYPGELEVVAIDDGSRDATAAILLNIDDARLRPLILPKNGGKSGALNAGLAQASHEIVITIDADTYLYTDALKLIVARYINDPPNTVAVAGAIFVRNSRKNTITKFQEWDYFHGIAVIKRVQSLYQGTLVAQGAFSLYSRDVVRELGGWSNCVGEDIVLSWGMLIRGCRIGYAENAVAFTNVPENYEQLFQQRRRWARGMFEALRAYPKILLTRRLSLTFVIINMFFPWIDLAYLLFFIPGLIAAMFGNYFFVGPMTLFLLPLMFINNSVVFVIQNRMFLNRGLQVRKNFVGFLIYALFSQLVLCPASLMGYLSECLRLRKHWGTK